MTDAEKLDKILEKVNDMDKKIDGMDIKLTNQCQRTDVLEKEVYGIPGQNNTGIKGRISIIESNEITLNAKIDKITGQFAIVFGMIITGINGMITLIATKLFGKH